VKEPLPRSGAPAAGDLAPTAIIDADHPEVLAFARAHAGHGTTLRERVAMLYLAVRDRIAYDPYRVQLSATALSASRTLAQGYGWCVPKAALLAAVCRASGIPARVGYVDVRNHLSTRRLREFLKTDVYYWHSYTAIHVDGRWLKATPAFDATLCGKIGLAPLEFDGTADSIFHAFDPQGKRHMEYVRYRGEFDDVPLGRIVETYEAHYPALMELARGEFLRDVGEESAAPPGA